VERDEAQAIAATRRLETASRDEKIISVKETGSLDQRVQIMSESRKERFIDLESRKKSKGSGSLARQTWIEETKF